VEILLHGLRYSLHSFASITEFSSTTKREREREREREEEEEERKW
jgi:hypothetical protein